MHDSVQLIRGDSRLHCSGGGIQNLPSKLITAKNIFISILKEKRKKKKKKKKKKKEKEKEKEKEKKKKEKKRKEKERMSPPSVIFC